MSRKSEDSYIFCAALIRASEKTLLPQAELIRAAEAPDFGSAMAVLSEYGYGDGKVPERQRDFVKLLAEEEKRAYDFVFSAVPEKKEIELFRYPKDYHNAKASLKAQFMETEPDKYLVRGGSFEPEIMVSMIREKNFMFMEPEMKEAVTQASETFGKGGDPQEVDIILDKACYRQMLRASEETGSSFLTGYIRLMIDMLNLTTFIRLRQIGKPWTFFGKVFLEGGNVPQNLFTASYEESFQKTGEKLAPYGLSEIMEKGGTEVKSTGMYSLLEKLCDNKKIEYIKDAKYISFGFEPAAAYLIAKDMEIKNLRMILTGKIAGTPKENIIERLRESYV